MLELLATYLTVPEIATRLALSPNTVASHVSSLHRKLGATSRSATVVALSECTLYALARRDILSLQREDLPAFTLVIMNLARDLSRRLRQMDAAAVK